LTWRESPSRTIESEKPRRGNPQRVTPKSRWY
jgi:hypothetical protein